MIVCDVGVQWRFEPEDRDDPLAALPVRGRGADLFARAEDRAQALLGGRRALRSECFASEPGRTEIAIRVGE